MDNKIFSFYFNNLKQIFTSSKVSGLAVDENWVIFPQSAKARHIHNRPTAYTQTCLQALPLQYLQQDMEIVIEFVLLGAQRIDGLDGMNHRRVVATAEGIANFREAV